MLKRSLYFAWFLAWRFAATSQDMHFTQFTENPSLVNPALTGAQGLLRASLNYKEQWRSVTVPYKTMGVSFDTRIKAGSWQQIDKFRSMTFKEKVTSNVAAGISVYSDRAGDGNLALNQLNLSLATFVPTDQKSFLSFGLQASLAQRKLDKNKLLFPNQYNGSGYDPGQASGEDFSSLNFTYADLAAGILWSYSEEVKKLNGTKQHVARIGFSCYHVNQPKQHYLSAQGVLFLKFVLNGDFIFSFPGSNMAIAPAYLLQFQGPSQELVVGTLLKYYFGEDSKYTGIVKRSCFSYGAFYRNNDALIFSMLIERRERFTIGLSYDINVSGLTNASKGRGGIEISLRYTTPSGYLYQNKKDNAASKKE